MESRGLWPRLATAVAVLLTLVVLGGLVYHRLGTGPNTGRVGSAAVSDVGFSCRLPILANASAAFITFPDGVVTIDGSVAVNPYQGGYGYSYDAPLRRWVPVPVSAISPDGRFYAYIAQTTGVPGEEATMSLHTREIVTGADRVLWVGAGSPMGPNLVAWLPAGIYFSSVVLPAGGKAGPAFPAVYVSDPSRQGPPRRVGPNPPPQAPSSGQTDFSSPAIFTYFGGGAAWATGNRVPTEAPSPNAPPAPGTFGPDRVLRMDLRDGTVSTWFTVAGNELVSLMGLDQQGRPILSLFEPKSPVNGGPPPAVYEPPAFRMLLLTGSNQTVEMSSRSADFHPAGAPSSDSHGIWFGSWNSIWLYTPGGGLHQVATIPSGLFPSPSPPPGYPAKSIAASGAKPSLPAYMQGTALMPAGPCS